jgi:hypothetical protein
MTTLNQDLKKLRKLKLVKERTTESDKQAKKEFDQFQLQVYQRMEQEDVQGHRTGDVLFTPTETPYAQVQDRAAFLAWAQDNDEQLFEPKERKELINQLVREKLDNSEPLPPGLGFYIKQYISQRAA